MASHSSSRRFAGRLSLAAVAAVLLAGSPSGEAFSAAQDPPIINDARIVGDDSRTRFIADLTAPIDVAVFTLSDPYRVVVDLPASRFALADGIGEKGRGLFTAFRYGLLSTDKSRIVLDLAGPVVVEKSFVIPPEGGQPGRLVIEVVPTTRSAFLEASLAHRQSRRMEDSARRDRALARPRVADSGKPLIVLDPGHGGIDMGARGRNGAIEKNVTLAFARALGKKLEESGSYEVVLTRTDDRFVALGERVAIARRLRANLFVSIHANSFRSSGVRGAIVYTVSEDASDQMAREVAESENESDVLAGLDIAEDDSDEVKDILLDLTRRETRNFGVVFARNLVEEMKTSNRMFKLPHKQASFRVLEAPDVPSAMIELGFISNREDEKLLQSEDWRQSTADSVLSAIDAYFRTQNAQTASQ